MPSIEGINSITTDVNEGTDEDEYSYYYDEDDESGIIIAILFTIYLS